MKHVVIITGGAGFLGSNLAAALCRRGNRVYVVDDFSSGRRENLSGLPVTIIEKDIRAPWRFDALDKLRHVDHIYHLACPASPADYFDRPLDTLTTASKGTENALRYALSRQARILVASTSEIYGDPLVHPQHEGYNGNVSTTDRRSVYDEGKRYAEALTAAYCVYENVDTRIARIFNSFGPNMRAGDGRVVPAFITAALRGYPITIHGDGTQTRSFCYVADTVRGLFSLMASGVREPVNIGNPDEIRIQQLAREIIDLSGSKSRIEYIPDNGDRIGPNVRCPVIGRAEDLLGWRPRVSREEGLRRTIQWFRSR